MFRELVQDREDLAGMVAYILYKRQKIEWIRSFHAKHDGIDPTDHEVAEEFTAFCGMPSQLGQYRDLAAEIVEDVMHGTLARDLMHRQSASQRNNFGGARPFWRGLLESIAANLMTVILTAGITGIAWVLVTGPSNLVKPILEQFFSGG